jgi:hypothetical protein
MKTILIAFITYSFISTVHAQEVSECEGRAAWQEDRVVSPNVIFRKCNVFGLDFIEVKYRLLEDRCISIRNVNTGEHWKDFLLTSKRGEIDWCFECLHIGQNKNRLEQNREQLL